MGPDSVCDEFPLVQAPLKAPLNKGRIYIVDRYCWQARSAVAPWHPGKGEDVAVRKYLRVEVAPGTSAFCETDSNMTEIWARGV